jgi:2-amino-4-hydroxy-6-hydroxymethyldihydropteridine diphosphokinase
MRAYVAVGSNLGDRWAHLALAARALREAPGVAVPRASRVWDAAPIGPPQPRYLNAVLELETTRTPLSLLGILRETERIAGRTRDLRWGPRTLDLDLILFGDLVVCTPGLTIPHPEMSHRRFVLAPLAELRPDLAVPGTGSTVARLLARAPELDVAPVGVYPLR